MLENLIYILNWDYGIVKGLGSLFTTENMFLICVGLFWLIFASIQDLRRREVENWWSFSLIIFVLAFRAFISIEKLDYRFFMWGIIGLAAGFLIAELLYYLRMFAGGDEKFLWALFVILPLSFNWKVNAILFIGFILAFVIAGAIYGLLASLIVIILHFKNFKKEFDKSFKNYKLMIFFVMILSFILFIYFIFLNYYLIAFLFALIFFMPLLLISAKAIEDGCMNKFVYVKGLTVGDWIVKPLNIKLNKGKIKIIEPYWEGLSESELNLIQKNYKGKVLVKHGLAFVPAFFFGFLLLLLVLWSLRSLIQ